MYFDAVKLFPVEERIKRLEAIYAHTKENHKEKLKEHMDLVYAYFLKLCKEKQLDNVFVNFEEAFFKEEKSHIVDIWKEMFCNAIYMHDLGKINANFQYLKMGNDKFKTETQSDSKHSMLSVCIYFDYYIDKIKNIKGEAFRSLLTFLFLNSYIISKHHGALDDFSVFHETLKNKYLNYIEDNSLYKECYEGFSIIGRFNIDIKDLWKKCEFHSKELYQQDSWRSIDLFIYTRFLFSLLVASDFYATSEYINGTKIESFGTVHNIDEFYSLFKKQEIYRNIIRHKEAAEGKGTSPFGEKNINRLRSEMFLEAENNLEKNYDKNMFYLEAPTGSGKTNTSINLAFKLLKNNKTLNKIFYIFPFNTLAEQTKKSLDDIFQENQQMKNEIAVINSITPIKVIDAEENNHEIREKAINIKIDYEKAFLDRQFLHYPIVLTTHINLFSHLFGVSREEVFTLAHIANSVIILDEIQSYKNSIWKEIITFLNKYAKLLNLKIIIMSATLPRLDRLIDCEKSFVNLIENRSYYFENPLFKNRVQLDFSLLVYKKNEMLEKLTEKVTASAKEIEGNILVEFINKNRAMDFYKSMEKINIEEKLNKEIRLITGDDNKADRNKIITQVKCEKNIILIATQVIEAGVDIDMDRGFKDISILDAEEQFLGRINRSCSKSGSRVYFFNLDEASDVYKKDYRKDKSLTLLEEGIREILKGKDFSSFYDAVMDRLEEEADGEKIGNINEFREDTLNKLQYEKIYERMKLIDDEKKYTVFLSRTIELEDGRSLEGKTVWENYENLLMDSEMPYGERKVKLSIVQEQMDYFTYNVDKIAPRYNGIIGNIFYIEDGEEYLTDGKFDRKKYRESNGGSML